MGRSCKSSWDKTVYQIIKLRLGPKLFPRSFFFKQGYDVIISSGLGPSSSSYRYCPKVGKIGENIKVGNRKDKWWRH